MKRVLLLSAYNAASHRYWHRQLQQGLAEFDWTILTLPPRHFSWRVRGNALSWGMDPATPLEQSYDYLIATSMCDLSALRGLRPALAGIPTLLYFHENQFAYPSGDHQQHSPVFNQSIQLYAACSAGRLVFNSEWNRSSFLTGVRQFCQQMPDAVPAHIAQRLEDKSQVLPVPVDASAFAARAQRQPDNGPVRILWNHRWEYDKRPEIFFSAVHKLQQAGVDFRLHVVGQSFRDSPDCFQHAQHNLARQIITWGHQSRDEYLRILADSDIVVSTAAHDFQGLAIQEACAAGCHPLAPAHLAYPEYLPAACLYPPSPEDPGQEAETVASRLQALIRSHQTAPLPVVDVDAHSWNALAAAYRQLIHTGAG